MKLIDSIKNKQGRSLASKLLFHGIGASLYHNSVPRRRISKPDSLQTINRVWWYWFSVLPSIPTLPILNLNSSVKNRFNIFITRWRFEKRSIISFDGADDNFFSRLIKWFDEKASEMSKAIGPIVEIESVRILSLYPSSKPRLFFQIYLLWVNIFFFTFSVPVSWVKALCEPSVKAPFQPVL